MTSWRVLVVEDEQYIRERYKQVLEAAGHDTVAVETGESADLAHQRMEFDIAIIDIGLPGISGTELARMIRQRDKRIAIVITTANDPELVKKETGDLNIWSILRKPCTNRCFMEKIKGAGELASITLEKREAMGREIETEYQKIPKHS